MTAPDHDTKAHPPAYWDGWNACREELRADLKRSGGDVDWTLCVFCNRGMFVLFDDGLSICEECAEKERANGN